jgi:hypothetical protein
MLQERRRAGRCAGELLIQMGCNESTDEATRRQRRDRRPEANAQSGGLGNAFSVPAWPTPSIMRGPYISPSVVMV